MAEFVVRRKLLLIAAGWMAVAGPVFGQGAAAGVNAPAYDVVAIKPNKSGTNSIRVSITADRYLATNVSLKLLIQYAYNLKTDDLISGLPGWTNSPRFDVEAKMDADAVTAQRKLPGEEGTAQRRLMMRSLLADRFRLKVHDESKELPIYALVVAKGGFKLKDADPNDTYSNGIKGPDGVSHAGMMRTHDGQLTAQAVPISNLVNNLSLQLHRQVVDQTGLTGKYDFALQWSPDEIPSEQRDAAGTSSGPSIFTALQEQLGLRLESSKGLVDTIVVDHVEIPSEN
jgi:uncharacterized protein (TIGR03435 family)